MMLQSRKRPWARAIEAWRKARHQAAGRRAACRRRAMNPLAAIFESLEVRLLLDASVPRDVFAHLDAPVAGGAPVPINVTVAPGSFTAAGGKVLVGFVHSAATGSTLNPGTITIRNAGTGTAITPLVSSLSISGSNGS